MLLKLVTFWDFWIPQDCEAAYCRWYVEIFEMCRGAQAYIENFLTNQLVEEFWKLIHVCQNYKQKSSGLLFLRHSVDKKLICRREAALCQ